MGYNAYGKIKTNSKDLKILELEKINEELKKRNAELKEMLKLPQRRRLKPFSNLAGEVSPGNRPWEF